MVIGQVGRFHTAISQHFRKGGISFKSEGLVLTVFGLCERSFHIHHSQIIRFQYGFYIFKEIGRSVYGVKCVKISAGIKLDIGSYGTVAHHAYGQRYRLHRCQRFAFLCRILST